MVIKMLSELIFSHKYDLQKSKNYLPWESFSVDRAVHEIVIPGRSLKAQFRGKSVVLQGRDYTGLLRAGVCPPYG